MSGLFSIKLKKLIDEFKLEVVSGLDDPSQISICCSDINRPGLHLADYYEYFDKDRIQIMGNAEISYLQNMPEDKRTKTVEKFFSHKPVAVILSRSIEPTLCMREYSEKYRVPVLRTDETTSTFSSAIISKLNVELAPRITRHGVLIEVYGEGIFILGDSGVGKSETAVELVKRGHRLIADDAVELRRVSSTTIVGSSPENIRHFLELRGIGIINARRLFGISAVKITEKVDLVIQMEHWDQTKEYDRLGMDEQYTSILGIHIPAITIPVNPGRNLAIIIEVAAMNNRQKKMGYNSAAELMHKLGMEVETEITETDWEI